MAQGSKSRIVIWTIVGILVVVAAVMLIKKPKGATQLPVNTERYVKKMSMQLEKLENKVAQARVDFPGAPAEQWQKIADGIAGIRQILAEMPGITEDKDLQVKVTDANKAYIGAKRMLKDITGKEDTSDSAGGE
jgi:hypothetical protein